MKVLCVLVLCVLAISGVRACGEDGTPMQIFVCGMASAVVDINWQECSADLSQAESNIVHAIVNLNNGFVDKSKSEIETGLKDMAYGLREIGAALGDCQLASIAEDIAALAASFETGVGEIEETIKIIVKGFDIYDDVYDIVNDWSVSDYFGMGKTMYKLIELLA